MQWLRLRNSRKFVDMLATVGCPRALVRSRVMCHVRNGFGMTSMRPRANLTPAILAGKDGSISSNIGPGSFRSGFSQLLDLTAPAFVPQPLAPQEPTRIGFVRTGEALSGALVKARERFGN